MQSQRITSEVALLIACCRWPVAIDTVRGEASGAIDWAQLLALARRHRVQGLVRHALDAAGVVVPLAEREALAEEARQVATRGLRLAAETLRLVRALEAVCVPVLVLKGTPLAMLAYGTLATKMAWDIDLLVPELSIDAAAGVLEAAGYACVLPEEGRDRLAAWHRFAKDSGWRHPERGTHVELHTRPVENPRVLPGLGATGPRQMIAIGGGSALPTFAANALFAYLCVHGAASGWRRAKWLADLAALLRPLTVEEVARLYAASQDLGAGRSAGQALLMCRRYLGIELGAELERTLRGAAITRAMAWVAGRMMTAPHGFDDPTETAAGTLPIHMTQLLILPGWRATLAELRRRTAPGPQAAAGLSPLGRLGYRVTSLMRRLRRQPAA